MNLVQAWDRVRTYGVSYPHQINDAGRSTSRRPKQKNDCTVRALALACGVPYDTAYDWMAEQGRKCSRGAPANILAGIHGKEVFGHSFCWESFPAVKGERRMNPVRFASLYPTGKYIVRVAKHVFCFIDGVGMDTFEERDDRCIYGVWHVTPV